MYQGLSDGRKSALNWRGIEQDDGPVRAMLHLKPARGIAGIPERGRGDVEFSVHDPEAYRPDRVPAKRAETLSMPLDLPAVIKTALNRQMAGFISRQPAPI